MNVSRYVRIGVFFLSLGSAGVGYVVVAGDGFNPWNTTKYEVVMSDATGLTTNAKVFLAGVPVGKIQSIDLEGDRAVLTLVLLKNVDVRSDAAIARQSSSILGTSMLALAPGVEPTPLGSGGRMAAAGEGADFRTALGSAQGLTVQVAGLLKEFQERQMQLFAASLETFNALAGKLEERSDAELDRVSRILESSALIAERFEALLRERQGDLDASAAEVRAALENIRAVTEEVRSGSGNLGRAVYDDELYRNLLEASLRTAEAAAKLSEVLDGAAGMARSATALADDARAVVKDAGGIVSKANALGVQVDASGRWGFLSGYGRAGASLRLEPGSRDRWYRVGFVSAGDGRSVRTLTTTSGSGGTVVVDETEIGFGPLLEAEIARTFGPLTLRGGLIEGSAGLGLDLRPLPWLELGAEAFGFERGALPNLRGAATVYPFFDPLSKDPWRWLYLRGGAERLLEPGRVDFFLGAGLRFQDEEARGLVGLVPLGGK